jgi:hypothetical protein
LSLRSLGARGLKGELQEYVASWQAGALRRASSIATREGVELTNRHLRALFSPQRITAGSYASCPIATNKRFVV